MDRIVFFDIDGTLIDSPRSWRLAAERLLERNRHLLGTLAFEEEFWPLWSQRAEFHFRRFMNGEISYVEQGRLRMCDVFEHVGAEISDRDADAQLAIYRDDCAANMPLYEDVLDCLASMGQRRLGVITNGQLRQQTGKLALHRLQDRFEVVLVSEEVGMPKPAAEVFATAADRAGLPPQRCLYVGDLPDVDALGALNAGMAGVWLRRDAQPIPENWPARPAVPVIESLLELAAVVEEWESRT
jgi:putative hydrolase of the HAD superfamily